MSTTVMLFGLAFCLAAVQLPPRPPDVAAQRRALKKLGFLVGLWTGDGRMLRPSGEWVDFDQTEHAEYSLDGLLLVIEGVGRSKADGSRVLQAYGIISYDDAAGTYHMRAFNDGRWLESDAALADDGKELSWGFTVSGVRTKSAKARR